MGKSRNRKWYDNADEENKLARSEKFRRQRSARKAKHKMKTRFIDQPYDRSIDEGSEDSANV